MTVLRRSLLMVAPTLIAARPSLGRVLRLRLGGGMAAPVLPGYFTTVNYGTVFKYNSGYSSGKYIGSDVWANTWHSDDQIYAVNDDGHGWQNATSSNMQVSLLSDYKTTLTGSNVNTMSLWGPFATGGSDGNTFKAFGIISVNGVLYATATRQPTSSGASGPASRYGHQNMQIIKSTDHGASWIPTPPSQSQPYNNTWSGLTTPMFSGTVNSNCWFVQYENKDYQNSINPVDGNDQYVYATSNDGFWDNGSYLYLGRVLITDLPKLDATLWSYYQGGAPNNPTWGPWGTAAPLINSQYKVSTNGIQYLPAFGCYIHIQWWYQSVVNNAAFDSTSTQWDVWQSTKLWGPWTLVSGASKVWNNPVGTPGRGLYNPNIMPKSLQVDGGHTAMITTAGDFSSQDAQTGDYTLTMVPVTIS